MGVVVALRRLRAADLSPALAGLTGSHRRGRGNFPMSAMTGILAGLATIGGAIALSRLARRAGAARDSLDQARNARWAHGVRPGASSEEAIGAVLDFERDPASGVYSAKS